MNTCFPDDPTWDSTLQNWAAMLEEAHATWKAHHVGAVHGLSLWIILVQVLGTWVKIVLDAFSL